jgi:signal transduction histidine kinase
MSSSPSSPFARTFGLRLGLWYAAVFLVASFAVMLLTYRLTAASLEERDRQLIQGKLAAYAAAYERGGIRNLTDTIIAEQQTAPERLFVRVLAQGAQTTVVSMPDAWSRFDLDRLTAPVAPDAEGWTFAPSREDRAVLEIGWLRLSDGTLVQVGRSTEEREDLLTRFRTVLGIVTLAIVAVALGGGLLVTRSALQPLRRLTEAVRQIVVTGRTETRVPRAHTGDAIDELTALFNAMLDRIERLLSGMRGALDNVSHDLRTPMTRLRGVAEMALAGPDDLHAYRDALADCIEASDRVLVMLDALMDISEAESGTLQLKLERVRVDDGIRQVVDLYRDVADAKQVALEGQPSPDLDLDVDPTRFQQVLANLVDNAVKYTPSGGRVEISAISEGDSAVVRVADTGIGISADELPHIWDRLFRGDKSRAERGLGLGLSLVKAIVQAHGGTVEADSAPGRGSTFTVRIPIRSPNPSHM